jgi:hypothetical protein
MVAFLMNSYTPSKTPPSQEMCLRN